MKSLGLNWNLDTIFEGGIESPAFAAFLRDLTASIADFALEVDAASDCSEEIATQSLIGLVARMQKILLQVRQADGFITCLKSENQGDRRVVRLGGEVKEIQAKFGAVLTRFDQLLLGASENQWGDWLAHEDLREIAFALRERRARAAEKLAPATESLIGELAIDGYHGWGELYLTIAAQLRVPLEEGEKVEQLSVGQAEIKLPNLHREARAALFESYEGAWARAAPLCADALNHLGGFRLRVYHARGWDSVLKEPLDANCLSEKTLNAMWDAVRCRRDVLAAYLGRKAAMLGAARLSWHDIDAPLGGKAKTYSYDEAAQLIIASFIRFDAKMGDFAARALSQGWVDAEMRAGKRNGGFSRTLPLSRQSRVLVSFGGTLANLKTLAHELGHAYHQDLMKDLPALAQRHPMTLAETASTFAENLLMRHLQERATDAPERLALLEARLQSAVGYLMNIAARFEFEQAFYRERKGGYVSVERLGELSVQAQQAAFGDLADYHPHFWAARRHFFFSNQPFYNFPYTFGFLFSAGLWHHGGAAAPCFGERYADLMRDSGQMTVEMLAAKHLNADLERCEFWYGALDGVLGDVERFLQASAASMA